jgi:uncharacterized protein
MKHRSVALITGVTLLWCASPARADETSKSAKAEALLQLVQGDQMMKTIEPLMKTMAGSISPDMPDEERAKIREMQKRMMTTVLEVYNRTKPTLAKIYADTYTEQELDGILAFYKSPVGKSVLEKMPEVMQRVAMIIGPEIAKKLQEPGGRNTPPAVVK